MNELIDEKIQVVLNLIRSNLKGDDALKITQAVDNLTRAKAMLYSIEESGGRPTKTKGAAA